MSPEKGPGILAGRQIRFGGLAQHFDITVPASASTKPPIEIVAALEDLHPGSADEPAIPVSAFIAVHRRLRRDRSPATNAFVIRYAMLGACLPKPVACSKAWAICKTLKSWLLRPTIWRPTGSPSGVKPAGTEAAGLPVAEIYQQDFIQSM